MTENPSIEIMVGRPLEAEPATFEWALVMMREGYGVRRIGWKKGKRITLDETGTDTKFMVNQEGVKSYTLTSFIPKLIRAEDWELFDEA